MQPIWSKRAFFALFLAASSVQAADHLDGPAVSADPAADITDMYAWMSSDASRAYLVMNVHPLATAESRFSDSVQYVFHTSSRAAFGDSNPSTTDLLCTFSRDQKIHCWLGDEEVSGDAGVEGGLASSSGKLRVFAGLRNDPFFFSLDGFKATVAAVVAAKPSLSFDAAGCPALDTDTVNTLVSTLASDGHGNAPVDFFLGLNTLSIVVSVDKTLINSRGDTIGVWGSTHRSN